MSHPEFSEMTHVIFRILEKKPDEEIIQKILISNPVNNPHNLKIISVRFTSLGRLSFLRKR